MRPCRDSKITIIALSVFFAGLGGYAFFEAHGILTGPQIDIPTAIMQIHEPSVSIRGSTKRIASLSMNGTPVSVTEAGVFDQTYIASEGYNKVVLQAHDKYGNTQERTIEVVYKPDSISSAQASLASVAMAFPRTTTATSTAIKATTHAAPSEERATTTETSINSSPQPMTQLQ
jgi:hypothetical protein